MSLLFISGTIEASNFKWYTTWVWGVAYHETTFRTKIGGIWPRGASRKFGTPYLFLQPLKIETSNLVYDLGLEVAYQETTFTTFTIKIGGVGAREHPKKIIP